MNGPTVTVERVRTVRPPTRRQLEAAALISDGLTFEQAGHRLGIQAKGVKWHVEKLAEVIPGDLPPRLRVIAWYRGAPRYVLENPRVDAGMRLAAALRSNGAGKK